MPFASLLLNAAALQAWYQRCDERDDYKTPPSRTIPNRFKPGETMLYVPARGSVHIPWRDGRIATSMKLDGHDRDPERPHLLEFYSAFIDDPENHPALEEFAKGIAGELPGAKVDWLISMEPWAASM